MEVTGRFAPSPSGRIHLGNILCCLLAWLSARKQGGRIVLRIEDLDTARCPMRYAEQMMEDLLWLGLDWDLGWQAGETEFCQSSRRGYYREAFDKLKRKRLLYPCYCSRKELLAASAPHASDGARVYDGRCRDLSPEEMIMSEQDRAWPPL